MDEKFPELLAVVELLTRNGYSLCPIPQLDNGKEMTYSFCIRPEEVTFRITEGADRRIFLVSAGFTRRDGSYEGMTLKGVVETVRAAKEIFKAWLFVRAINQDLYLRHQFFGNQESGGVTPLDEIMRNLFQTWIEQKTSV